MSVENSPEESFPKEWEILQRTEKPKNSLQKQFQLAEDLYQREIIDKDTEHRDLTLNKLTRTMSGRNEVMNYWATSKYSEFFRNFISSPDFKTHRRFKGEFQDISIEDIDYYIKNKKLPD